MRKLLTKLLVFLLAVTSVFGLTGIKSVKAEDVIANGFKIEGASLRSPAGEDEYTGIRFETTVSQEAFDAIIADADGKEVRFGTLIKDNDSDSDPIDFCSVTTGKVSGFKTVSGEFTYYASITFNNDEFDADVIEKVKGSAVVNLDAEREIYKTQIALYRTLAYAELLDATSYYQFGEDESTRVFTQTLTRSMRMVANWYVDGDLLKEAEKEFIINKNYFKAVNPITGYGYLRAEDGKIVNSDGEAYVIGENVQVAYKAQNIPVVDGKLDLSNVKFDEELGKNVTLYFFDANNNVSELTAKYVTNTITCKEDLRMFDVTYTFSQAEYEELLAEGDEDKIIAYLEDREANPFTYYDGYYVLTKNIDADTTSMAKHESVFKLNTTKAADSDDDSMSLEKLKIGFSIDAEGNLVAQNRAAIITYNNVEYKIPRSGFPLFAIKASTDKNGKVTYERAPAASVKKQGFYGTFDGQGYVIDGLESDSRVIYYSYDNNTDDPSDDIMLSASDTNKTTNPDYYQFAEASGTMGAGLFGLVHGSAVFKNVAFDNLDVDFGQLIAMYNVEVAKNARVKYENVYIKLVSGRNWGIIYYRTIQTGSNYVNCFFDFTACGTKSGSSNDYKNGYNVLGETKYSETNTGWQTKATNLYIAIPEATSVHKHNLGTPNVNLDVTFATTVEGLYTQTTNAHDVEVSMATDFAENTYFKVTKEGKVYWKKLFENSLVLSTDLITLTKEAPTASVSLNAMGSAITPDEVTFNKDIFDYVEETNDEGEIVDRYITFNKYVAGTYEAYFKVDDKVVVLQIVLPAIPQEAFLQEDGELVLHGLDSIEGKTFKIAGAEVPATMEKGKVFLDLTGVKLPALQGKIEVVLDGVYGVEAIYNCEYVTLAIDEGDDLKYFNVGYTYKQEEYDKKTNDDDRKAYLAQCQASPFDYYEGYYVLATNVNASGIVFEHEAIVALSREKSSTAVATVASEGGYTISLVRSGNVVSSSTFVPLEGIKNMAQDYDGNGTAEGFELDYAFPRSGFPLASGQINVTDIRFGFRGIFDGKGHIIYNLNDTVRTPVQYYIADGSLVSSYDVGAGLFGIMQKNSSIKNTAFVNIHVGKSSGLAMYGPANNKYSSENGVAKSGYLEVENMFFKTAESEYTYGILWGSCGDSVNASTAFKLRFIVIDAPSHTGKVPVIIKGSTSVSTSGLNGGVLGGDRQSTNRGLEGYAGFVYIAMQNSAHELYQGVNTTNATHVQKRYCFKPVSDEEEYAIPTAKTKADFVTSYSELFKCVDLMGTADKADDVTMVKALTETVFNYNSYSLTSATTEYNVSAYWEKIGDGVYWKGVYNDYYAPKA